MFAHLSRSHAPRGNAARAAPRRVTAVGTLLVLVALLFVVNVAHAQDASPNRAGIIKSQFIYEKAPFPECHASTIVETDGGILAAWFGGTEEGNRDVGIWLSRLADGRWTEPVEVATGVLTESKEPKAKPARYPCWNPVLFQPREGPLALYYKVGPSPQAWWGMLITSGDGGKSWSQPRRLPDGILGPIKNKPIQLAGGDILSGSSTEHAGWRVHFERSADGGKTWQATPPVNDGKKIGAIQPTILRHGENRLQVLGRTQQRRIFEIWSDDGGRTWSEMTLTGIPHPNSGIDAVTLADGRHLLVYNHTNRGRSPLNVAISKDGKTWQAAVVLEDQPGEYSYPAVIQTGDGLVHVTYTWKRERVRHVVLDPTKFNLRPIENGKWPQN
jgi:predicted neuraminidase